MAEPLRIVFVCTGNICRSPTAHALMRDLLAAHGLAQHVEMDSAGLATGHAGQPPDARSILHARRRGHDLSALRARAFTALDFERADLVLVMDEGHWRMAGHLCPPQHAHKLRRVVDYCRNHRAHEVPDPYYGEAIDFERVLDLLEDACGGLLADLGSVRAGGLRA